MNPRRPWILLLALAVLGGCGGGHEHPAEVAEEDESWAVTAWGEHFEIFAEADPLELGATSMAFTHVTTLKDFSPLVEGVVSVVLVDASGGEAVFTKEISTRPGIFSIDVVPESPGEFDLVFRVTTAVRQEDVSAGRVRVGEAGSSGGLVEPAPTTAEAEGAAGGAEISFLKEQQWKTEFATSWVEVGEFSESVSGPGRVEPAAGGEVLLTSPIDGVVSAPNWPFSGQEVAGNAVVFRVTPRVASGLSLAEFEARAAGLEAELEVARKRLARLEGLLEMGATSPRERDEAEARVATLESRQVAATRNLERARAGRQGGPATTEAVAVRAPFPARVARVDLTPGEAVPMGAPLGLLVRDRPLWLAVALKPEAAAGLGAPEGLDVRLSNGREPMTFRGDGVRFVSFSPKVDPATGTVTALFEVDASVGELPIGSLFDAQVLLAQQIRGVVVPQAALVDDGGVPVVYLQVGGESFVRAEVAVVGRQGGRALVEGLPPGARVVDQGGNAIRRATLVASDVGEAHIH